MGHVPIFYNAHRLILRLTLAPVAIVVVLLAQATSFATILPLIILHSIFLAPVMPFMDGYGVAVGERYKLSFRTDALLGHGGLHHLCLFDWAVDGWAGNSALSLCLCCWSFIACLVTFGLPPLDINTSRPDWGDALGLLRQRPMLILIATSWLVSIGFSSFNTFFSIYLAEMNGTHLIGIANITLAASELPVLFYSNELVERLGIRRMLTIGIIGYALRFILMSVAPSTPGSCRFNCCTPFPSPFTCWLRCAWRINWAGENWLPPPKVCWLRQLRWAESLVRWWVVFCSIGSAFFSSSAWQE